ncbi:MAG: hypothetical protein M1820_009749 [Bogoriella megaspora]|nr:MAG: hypothetical protein M1820_009749 [Bogoriella megaspora]
MADSQKQLQALSDEFQKLQGELQTTVEARQRLEAQEQENKSVQKEFSKLNDDAGIYKLVGPVLLKQDKIEATMAVDGRLEYIGKEMFVIIVLGPAARRITDIEQQADRRADHRHTKEMRGKEDRDNADSDPDAAFTSIDTSPER